MTRFPVTVLYFGIGEPPVHGLAETVLGDWMWVQPADQTLIGSSFNVGDEGMRWIHGHMILPRQK